MFENIVAVTIAIILAVKTSVFLKAVILPSASSLAPINFANQLTASLSHFAKLSEEKIPAIVFWIFSKDTIDEDVYKKVKSKGKYTSSYYLKSNGIHFPKQEN
jgi:hypothetical protein